MKLLRSNTFKPKNYPKYIHITSYSPSIPITSCIPPTNTIMKLTVNQVSKLVDNTFCSYCGNKYMVDYWPRKCDCCQNMKFRNPIPVAVGLLPFRTKENEGGLLLVRRNVKPFIGELCLPGGFIDWGESWQQAISREVEEETFVKTDPDEFNLANIHSTPDGTRVLIFGYTDKIRDYDMLKNFKETNETSELLVGDKKTELCFSLHKSVYDDWFKNHE